jgi:hypothetical protein
VQDKVNDQPRDPQQSICSQAGKGKENLFFKKVSVGLTSTYPKTQTMRSNLSGHEGLLFLSAK